MTTYRTTPTPLGYELEGAKVLIASTLDSGHTQFTGLIDFVGAGLASFDLDPDGFTGEMDNLDPREWEIFLQEEPMPTQAGLYKGESGAIYLLAKNHRWYQIDRIVGQAIQLDNFHRPGLTLIHDTNLSD